VQDFAAQARDQLEGGLFQQNLIVARLASSLELIPHVVGENRRPTGQRGALLWFRTGSTSNTLVPNAFRLLDIVTACS
jgi:predicted phage gp36 major capsid-like protein